MLDHSSMMFPETAHFSGRVVHVASNNSKQLTKENSRHHDRTRPNRRSRLTVA